MRDTARSSLLEIFRSLKGCNQTCIETALQSGLPREGGLSCADFLRFRRGFSLVNGVVAMDAVYAGTETINADALRFQGIFQRIRKTRLRDCRGPAKGTRKLLGERNLDARQRSRSTSPPLRSTSAFAATQRSIVELPDGQPVHVARILGFGADGVSKVTGFVFSRIKELMEWWST